MKKARNINILNEEGIEDENETRHTTVQFFIEITQVVFNDEENQVEDSNINYNNINKCNKNNDWSKVDNQKAILLTLEFDLEREGNKEEIKINLLNRARQWLEHWK